jgi:hypothetical protein
MLPTGNLWFVKNPKARTSAENCLLASDTSQRVSNTDLSPAGASPEYGTRSWSYYFGYIANVAAHKEGVLTSSAKDSKRWAMYVQSVNGRISPASINVRALRRWGNWTLTSAEGDLSDGRAGSEDCWFLASHQA